MNTYLMPAIMLAVTGLLMGLFLAYASKKFEVEVDPKVEEILGILPGVNCGACGFPGCAGYANGVALEGAPMSNCAPGGAEVAKKIGAIMGSEVEVSEDKMVAKLLCQGNCEHTTKKYEYDGSIQTCASMALYSGGDKSCSFSCIGLGDCIKVCPVDAISFSGDGLVKIDEDLCISCKQCVVQCPKKVLAMLPQKKKVTVKCSSKDNGATAKKACKTACIGCSACVRVCPTDAITVESNLAKIDPDKCIECGLCADKCPTKAITNENTPEKTAAVRAKLNGEAEATSAKAEPAGEKKALIIADKCVGCTACARVCPTTAITGAVKTTHIVDPEKCIGCSACFDKCKFSAIQMVDAK